MRTLIREYRKELGLTQEELVEMVGVTRIQEGTRINPGGTRRDGWGDTADHNSP